MYIVVDKSHKISLSVFLRCLGLVTDEDIINMFGDEECLRKTLEKDETKDAEDPQVAALAEFFKKIRNNEPFSVDNAKSIPTRHILIRSDMILRESESSR